MEARGRQQEVNTNPSRGWIARAQWLLGVAVCVAVGGLLHVSVAQGVCCVCQGALNSCGGFVETCLDCAFHCETELLASVRACCQDADCSNGVADDCPDTAGICTQIAIGFGFCDGTCAGTAPTATPTLTATSTSTATAAIPAPAPTLQPLAVITALGLLAAIAALGLRRRKH